MPVPFGHPPWYHQEVFNEAVIMTGSIKQTPQLSVTDRTSQAEADRATWRTRTPEERLDEVEALRLRAGKFLYEYPTRLRRLLAVARGSSR
jgi:hypothetical protein